MDTKVDWIELNDVGINATHEQHVLLEKYLISILKMHDADDRLRLLTRRCAHAALAVARSGIDPRALIVVTQMAKEMHDASL